MGTHWQQISCQVFHQKFKIFVDTVDNRVYFIDKMKNKTIDTQTKLVFGNLEVNLIALKNTLSTLRYVDNKKLSAIQKQLHSCMLY